MAELILAEKVGITGEQIMFTSNDTPASEYRKAMELGAIINLDDLSHIPFLEKHADLPVIGCFRYNPGALKEGNAIIGVPEEAKYGFTREQLYEGYKLLRDKGITRFGLHTMVASNELDHKYFIETADMLFDLVREISQELGIEFEFVNLGGGIGIPYKPEQAPVDISALANGVKQSYESRIVKPGVAPLKIYMECGRYITGPFGWLLSRVLHKKHIYKDYVGLDASMANLMRPALYGSYHHISVLGKETSQATNTYDVTGSLCENNDKFAIDRSLPPIEIGDILAIHDTGAHGHSMGFNYNGKLRSAELLRRRDGSFVEIRRAETYEDHFATLNFGAVAEFEPDRVTN
jgi:diaminopimelate decarboxylase